VIERLKQLFARRHAWRERFRDENGALNAAALPILADLQRFCYATRPTIKVSPTTGQVDPYAMAIAEGRRECWLRIQEYLKLDDRDLQALLKQHNDEVFSDDN
jgi:hypothetical protein